MRFRGERIPDPDNRVQVFITKDGVEMPLCPQCSQAVCNHNPDGFEWGHLGSGPSQLALGLLLKVMNNADFVLTCYSDFEWSVVSGLPKKGWTLTAEVIQQWINEWKTASDRFGVP